MRATGLWLALWLGPDQVRIIRRYRLEQHRGRSRLLEDAPEDGEQYARQDGAWSVVESTVAGLVISETEPAEEDRLEGMQWLDTSSATVWIWDGAQWLQFRRVALVRR